MHYKEIFYVSGDVGTVIVRYDRIEKTFDTHYVDCRAAAFSSIFAEASVVSEATAEFVGAVYTFNLEDWIGARCFVTVGYTIDAHDGASGVDDAMKFVDESNAC
jgi:hypothetical protein